MAMVITGTGVGVTTGAGVFVGFAADVIAAVIDGKTGVVSNGAQEDLVAGRSQPIRQTINKVQINTTNVFKGRAPILVYDLQFLEF